MMCVAQKKVLILDGCLVIGLGWFGSLQIGCFANRVVWIKVHLEIGCFNYYLNNYISL